LLYFCKNTTVPVCGFFSDYQLYNVPSGPQSHTRPLDQLTSFVVSFGCVAAAFVACCLLLKVRYE
jgi:hypothetical protein